VTVNCRESCREYLATMFTCESKSWRAGSQLVLLRAADWREISDYIIIVYTCERTAATSDSKNMTAVESVVCEHDGVK
jgi:hypothetical protein